MNRLRKEINRLLSKEMSNIYLKVTIDEKNQLSQNFDFLGLKSHVSFGEIQLAKIFLNFETSS